MSSLITKIFQGKRTTKQSGYQSQVSEIGTPFEVKHNVHVGFNHATGKIEGLPTPWLNLISDANISQSEQLSNPEAVISALKMVTYSMRKKPKYLGNEDNINNEIQEIEDAWPSSKESSKLLLEEEDEEGEFDDQDYDHEESSTISSTLHKLGNLFLDIFKIISVYHANVSLSGH